MEVTFYGTYDKKIFLEALQLTERRARFNTIFRYFALGLSLFIIVGAIYGWIIEGMDQAETGRLIRSLATAIFIGYFYFSALIVRNRSIANIFRSGPYRTMQGSINLEGVIIGTALQNATIEWHRFVRKGEKGQLVALRTSDGSVAVFHRDFFAAESDWQRFRQLANQKVIEPK